MKAEQYLARFFHKELKKTVSSSKRLACLIVKSQAVRAIKEGPDVILVARRSYVN